MPILDPDDLATLKAYVAANPSLTTAQAIFEATTAPTAVSNPVAVAPQIPKAFGPTDVLGLVSPASLAKIKTEVTMPLSDLNRSIMAQDRPTIGSAAQLYLAFGDITQAEHDAILGVLTATVPDPSWTPTVLAGPSWQQTNLGAFGSKTWKSSDTGSTHNFAPVEAIAEAM